MVLSIAHRTEDSGGQEVARIFGMMRTSRGLAGLLLGGVLVFSPWAPGLPAQERGGSTGAALGGALLGAYSGTVFGLLGGSGPCNRTLYGTRCPRIAAAVGGTLGLASGVWMGLEDTQALRGRARGAGYGAVIGGLVGFGLSRGVRQYGWADVGMFAAVGAGIGASPTGAGVGFAAGATVGALGWILVPEWKIGDAVALSLVGLAAGGLAGWVTGTNANAEGKRAIAIPLQIRF